MFSEICFHDVSKLRAVISCFAFAALYVGSLYIKSQRLPRDHPKTIKERILRVTLVSMVTCCILYLSSSQAHSNCRDGTFLEWIGVRTEGLIPAIVLPIIIIAILFLGPITMSLMDHGIKPFMHLQLTDIMLWRNYFVAPLSEELVFRGYMLPLLAPSFGNFASIFLAPWFFGLAHIHHATEQYKTGYYTLASVVASTLFQTSYTTVFGILSSYIFLRTGHLASAFVSHSFCNMMGFPDFELAIRHRHKYLICACFVVGLLCFVPMLPILTQPLLFSNALYDV